MGNINIQPNFGYPVKVMFGCKGLIPPVEPIHTAAGGEIAEV
jgi:hypothetical protein